MAPGATSQFDAVTWCLETTATYGWVVERKRTMRRRRGRGGRRMAGGTSNMASMGIHFSGSFREAAMR